MPFQWNAYGDANFDGISVPHGYGNRHAQCYTNGDSYSDCNGYYDCNGYGNSYCDSYCHGDFHSHFHPNYDSTTNSDIYTYGYFDDYTQANAYGPAACNAEGTTHPAAAPESVIGASVVTSEWAGVTDPGYSLSRPSITFSMPLTTSVKRS